MNHTLLPTHVFGRTSILFITVLLVLVVSIMPSCRNRSLTPEIRPIGELISAIEKGSVETVKSLLLQGVSPNGRDADGRRILNVAVYSGNTNIVELLLAHGADPNQFGGKVPAGPFDTWAPIEVAVQTGNVELIQMLVRYGARVNFPPETFITPLHRAVVYNRIGVVRVLLNAGSDPDAPDFLGNTPIQLAGCMPRREEIFKELVSWKKGGGANQLLPSALTP